MRFHELPDETPETFLDALFNRDDEVNIHPTRAVGLFTMEHKIASWLTDTSAANSTQGKRDIYYGATLQCPRSVARIAQARKQMRPRWYAESAVMLGALWLDADVANDSHKKDNLFPDEDAALDFLYNQLAIPPSFVVRTGGGFHAYWLLNSVIPLTDKNRDRIAALVHAWQDFCRDDAKLRGYEMDATHDLARLLRLPGTVNSKYDADVVCVAEDGVESLELAPMHDVSSFDLLCGARVEEILTCSSAEPTGDVEVGPCEGLDVSVSAFKKVPPQVDGMCSMSTDFAALWNREREDLPSQSEYDLAIANALCTLGMSDQVVVDALIVHRRDAGLEPKARVDYYARTLAKAKSKTGLPEMTAEGAERALKQAEARLREDNAAARAGVDPEDVRPLPKRMGDLNEMLGGEVEVRGVLKYPGDPPTYALMTDLGNVTLGDASVISSGLKMRNAIANATGRLIRRHKNITWDPIAQALLDVAEEQDLGDASHPARELAAAVAAYLDETHAGTDRTDSLSERLPWIDSETGETWGHLGNLTKWLRQGGDKATQRSVAQRLKELGSTSRVLYYTKRGKRGSGQKTSTSYWRLSGLQGGQRGSEQEAADEAAEA